MFVPSTAPGDRVLVGITEVRTDFQRGRILKLLEPSPSRGNPHCPLFQSCGGCQWQHLKYQTQVEAKRAILEELLSKGGRLKGTLVPPVLTPIGPWNYRARTQLKLEARGRDIVLGFYRSRSHHVVEVLDCPVLLSSINQVLSYLHSWTRKDQGLKESLSLFREVHFMAETGEEEVLLSFIGPRIDTKMVEAVKGLKGGFPLLKGITFLGAKGGTWVWGQGFVTARVFDLSLRISAGSFFQVNEKGAEALVKKVLEYADLKGEETVLDLYSGVGTFTLPLAQRSRKVVGVELDMQATVDALYNLEKNRIENCEIWNIATEEALESHILRDRWDVVVLDPPRLGLTKKALQGLSRMSPPRIIYVSCDPSTLARDVFRLSRHGYRCLEVQPLDLYPQTYHIEAVALLEKG